MTEPTLNAETTERLICAALAAGLDRTQLLHGLPHQFVASIPSHASLRDQLREDLHALGRTQLSTTDRSPLEIWLENAERMAHPRVEAHAFVLHERTAAAPVPEGRSLSPLVALALVALVGGGLLMGLLSWEKAPTEGDRDPPCVETLRDPSCTPTIGLRCTETLLTAGLAPSDVSAFLSARADVWRWVGTSAGEERGELLVDLLLSSARTPDALGRLLAVARTDASRARIRERLDGLLGPPIQILWEEVTCNEETFSRSEVLTAERLSVGRVDPGPTLNWYEATAFATWLGGRLPTVAELNCAPTADDWLWASQKAGGRFGLRKVFRSGAPVGFRPVEYDGAPERLNLRVWRDRGLGR